MDVLRPCPEAALTWMKALLAARPGVRAELALVGPCDCLLARPVKWRRFNAGIVPEVLMRLPAGQEGKLHTVLLSDVVSAVALTNVEVPVALNRPGQWMIPSVWR